MATKAKYDPGVEYILIDEYIDPGGQQRMLLLI